MEALLADLKIPNFIIKIFEESGFETISTLELLTSSYIDDIEEIVNTNRALVINTRYKTDGKFKFLPGHRALLLNLPKEIEKRRNNDNLNHQYSKEADFYKFSLLLRKLIESAAANMGKHTNAARYSDVIKDFATYIYLQCGKACYETLCANLPIPKADTIRKCI